MRVDTADYRAALTPPTFVHDGRTYVGRLLSVEQWIALVDTVGALLPGAPMREVQRVYLLVCDTIFPPRGRWRFWARGEVGRIVRRLPLTVQAQILESFLSSLAALHGMQWAPRPGTKVTEPTT